MSYPQWSHIIVHCSDTPNGRAYWRRGADTGTYDNLAIDEWHFKRGFRRDPLVPERLHLRAIGYHKVIEISGAVAQGRTMYERGAHTAESMMNSKAIGICLIGKDAFTAGQWCALAREITILQQGPASLAIPEENILGHRDITSKKECPGFDVQAWVKNGMKILPNHLCVRKR